MSTTQKYKTPLIIKVLLISFMLYAVVSFMSLQSQIVEKEQQLQQVKLEVETQERENNAISEELQKSDQGDKVASVARDKLGYAYPQERIFVDASSQ